MFNNKSPLSDINNNYDNIDTSNNNRHIHTKRKSTKPDNVTVSEDRETNQIGKAVLPLSWRDIVLPSIDSSSHTISSFRHRLSTGGKNSLIRLGIPPSLRFQVWELLLSSHLQPLRLEDPINSYRLAYERSIYTLSISQWRDIDKDVKRSSNHLYERERLRRILLAFSSTHIQIGYCQAMSHLVTFLLHIYTENKNKIKNLNLSDNRNHRKHSNHNNDGDDHNRQGYDDHNDSNDYSNSNSASNDESNINYFQPDNHLHHYINANSATSSMFSSSSSIDISIEERCYWLFSSFVLNVLPVDYYSSSLLGSRTDTNLLTELFRNKLPKLSGHFDDLSVSLSVVSLKWLMGSFVLTLPFNIVSRVWDCLLFEQPGAHLLINISLALLLLNQTKLLSIKDTSTLLSTLSNIGSDISDADQLIRFAYKGIAAVSSSTIDKERKQINIVLLDEYRRSLYRLESSKKRNEQKRINLLCLKREEELKEVELLVQQGERVEKLDRRGNIKLTIIKLVKYHKNSTVNNQKSPKQEHQDDKENEIFDNTTGEVEEVVQDELTNNNNNNDSNSPNSTNIGKSYGWGALSQFSSSPYLRPSLLLSPLSPSLSYNQSMIYSYRGPYMSVNNSFSPPSLLPQDPTIGWQISWSSSKKPSSDCFLVLSDCLVISGTSSGLFAKYRSSKSLKVRSSRSEGFQSYCLSFICPSHTRGSLDLIFSSRDRAAIFLNVLRRESDIKEIRDFVGEEESRNKINQKKERERIRRIKETQSSLPTEKETQEREEEKQAQQEVGSEFEQE